MRQYSIVPWETCYTASERNPCPSPAVNDICSLKSAARHTFVVELTFFLVRLSTVREDYDATQTWFDRHSLTIGLWPRTAGSRIGLLAVVSLVSVSRRWPHLDQLLTALPAPRQSISRRLRSAGALNQPSVPATVEIRNWVVVFFFATGRANRTAVQWK